MELRGSVEYNLQLALESSGVFGVIPFTARSSLSGRTARPGRGAQATPTIGRDQLVAELETALAEAGTTNS